MGQRKKTLVLLVIMGMISITSIVGQIYDPPPAHRYDVMQSFRPQSSVDKAVAESICRFGFDLYPRLNKAGENLCFSPLSINAAMSMVAAGAKGKTLEEMQQVFHLPISAEEYHSRYHNLIKLLNASSADSPFSSEIANALFMNELYGNYLNPDYTRMVRDQYLAELFSMSMSHPQKAADTVNKWVANKTRNKIMSIISKDDINDHMVMMILNSVFFKAEWADEFKANDSFDRMFYPHYKNGDTGAGIEVKTMYKKARFPFASVGKVKLLEMGYKGGEFSMIFFLPEDMTEFEKTLNRDEFVRLISHLNVNNQVQVHLPKFKIENFFDLTDTIKSMGMPLAFDALQADFGGMLVPDTDLRLFIRFIIHKTFIEVNEKGTEAAAVTAIGMEGVGCAAPEEIIDVFRADHPFIYALVHKPSMSLLFLGKVSNPKP